MAKRVQSEDIIRMNELYLEIGTYAGVAREVGFSGGTVKRYIIPDFVPQDEMTKEEKITFEIKGIGELAFPESWNDFLKLTDKEKVEIKELQKGIVL